MKIATWNINGVKARIDNLTQWLKDSDPDIVCLQEIKTIDDAFPRLEIEALGYHVETHGQKGFNGVAILSKTTPDEVNRGLPAIRWTSRRASSKPSSPCRGTRSPASAASTCRTAIRSTRRNIPTSSPGWSACGNSRSSGWNTRRS
jgi:exonuclease III